MLNAENFFVQEITLENERAILSPLKKESIDQLKDVAFHPQIWEWGMSNIKTNEDLEKYIQTALKERDARQSYPFIIFDKASNQVAGSTRYGSISLPNKRLEIGWTWMHPDFQGTGLNKACKLLLLEFAFESLGMNRVELKTDVLNNQSRRGILKIGATEEGIFRKHQVTASGRVRDSVFFSIIKEEWPAIKTAVFGK